MRQIGLIAIKLASSVALVWYVLTDIDVDAFLVSLKMINVWYFFVGVAIAAISILVKSYKWSLLLQAQGGELSLGRLQALNYIGLFVNNLVPSGIGGDVYRIYKTAHCLDGRCNALAAVVMERITGLAVLWMVVVVSAVTSLSLANPIVGKGHLYAILGVSAALLGLACGMYLCFVEHKWKDWIQMNLGGLRQWLTELPNSIHAYSRHTIMIGLLLSFFYQIILSITMYIFGLAAAVRLNVVDVLLMVSLVTFLVMLPISLNGIGVQEGAFYFYLQRVGVEPSSALLIAILPRIGMVFFSLIGAALLLYEWGRPREYSGAIRRRSAEKGLESR